MYVKQNKKSSSLIATTFARDLYTTRYMRLLSRWFNISVSGSEDVNQMTNVVDDTVRRKHIRNRWCKAVTLVNNPSLVFERLLKLYQKEMELVGDGEDERFRLKVIDYCAIKISKQLLLKCRS